MRVTSIAQAAGTGYTIYINSFKAIIYYNTKFELYSIFYKSKSCAITV